MKLQLQELDGTREVRIVDSFPYLLGRDADCDLCINHVLVSRRHAKFIERDGRFVLCDLESTNGTYVNGERVLHECVLHDGDGIVLGVYVARVFIVAPLRDRFRQLVWLGALERPSTVS